MSDARADIARAYEGMESPEAFPDADALARYRQELLAISAPQADFLLDAATAPLDVLEVACGNGRLLVELARRGALRSGLGSDIAASRITFARKWARDEGLDVEFRAEDLLEAAMPSAAFDVAACITGALAYFEPLGEGLAARVLSTLRDTLRPGGLLVVELYPHPEYRHVLAATGEARIWRELPPSDPWRFYLSELHLEGNVVTHRKTFVHRHDGRIDEGRRERLMLYTPDLITALLGETGFEQVALFEGWSREPYAGGEILVATARRPG